MGNRVGELARDLVGHGCLIEHQGNLGRVLADTETWQYVQPDQPISEATFERDGVLVRADARRRSGSPNW